MCSSLYPPNEVYLARFAGVTDFMNLDFTVQIETTTLDIFCQEEGVDEIDFLQTDVQGADLQVLEGSAAILARSVLGVKVEVFFQPLYVDSPIFTEVDTYLRKQGFSLFGLKTIYRPRARSPIVSTVRPGQLLWGDAFYLRDLILEDISTPLKTPDRLLKLACIADVMEFSDYAVEVLEYLTLQYGTDTRYNCANNIIECLAQFPELVQQGLGSLPIVAKIRDYASGEALELLRGSENS
jgi:hypothetical protein